MNERLEARIQRLEDLCNLQTTLRARYAGRLHAQATSVDLVILIVSFCLAITAFGAPGDLGEALRGRGMNPALILAILSSLNFLSVLLVLYFRPAEAARKQREARHHFAAARHDMKRLRDDPSTDEHAVDRLKARYLDDNHFGNIPERLFLKYKAWHVLKLAVSEAIAANPGVSARELRRRLRK